MPPTIINAPLWNHQSLPNVILISASATISARRGLSLDSRFALQARKYSQLPLRKIAAHLLSTHPTPRKYGFLPLAPEAPEFALFQTALNTQETARYDLIKLSAHQLAEHATAHPDTVFGLPFPGVGKRDNLDPRQTFQILLKLPANVRLHVPARLRSVISLPERNP